jgi:lambda family phage portal protein
MRLWPFSRKSDAQALAAQTRQEPVPPRRRGFQAARPDRLAGGFSIFAASPRAEIRRDIRGLVGHARHAARNMDVQRSYEMLARRHVVGPAGIRLQMDVRDAPDRPDEAANRLIEQAWARWGRRGNATLCGRLSWWDVENIAITGLVREGGLFVRLRRGTGPYGLQVEPLQFDLLDLDLTGPVPGGGVAESGIEFDDDGRVLAYHFWRRHPAEAHHGRPQARLRIPAREVVHVLVHEEVGQSLGIPRSATALRLMNMAEKFQESAMAAAHYGAANMMFFTQEDSSGQISAAAATEVPIDEMEAGTMAVLPPGVTPTNFSPAYPDAQVEPFMRHMSNTMAAGLGVSAETLTADLSRANFSSLRAGKGEERDEWRMLQRVLFEDAWLPAAMAAGRVPLPLSRLDKFRSATWRPRGWASVNPKDDANARKTEVEMGLRSRTEIAAERGRDYADIVAELAAEQRLLDANGVRMPAPPAVVMMSGQDGESDG